MSNDKPIIHWENLYKERWNDLISPSAISHPAKFSHGLIRRIYEYALEQGYITVDSKVLDPFGGVALGSFYAVNSGLIWLACELEDKFYQDAYKNFALWCERFWCVCDDPEYLNLLRQYATPKLEEFPQLILFSQDEVNPDDLLEQIKTHTLASWGKENKGSYCKDCGKLIVAYPVLLKGDSRHLSSIIAEQVDGSIASPPYATEALGHSRGASGQQRESSGKYDRLGVSSHLTSYGASSEQLGNMPAGDLDSIVGSPPYIDTPIPEFKTKRFGDNQDRTLTEQREIGYGTTDGQLGSLKEGSLDALVSSSPFADSIGSDDPDKRGGLYADPKRRNDKNLTGSYGASEGQLGTMKDEGFDGVIGSPPFAQSDMRKGGSDLSRDKAIQTGRNPDAPSVKGASSITPYGTESGQLANLPDKGFDLSVSSPSFAGNTGGRGDASRNGIDPALFDRSSGGMKRGTGESEDNLDHLPMKGFDSAITSPPFENQTPVQDVEFYKEWCRQNGRDPNAPRIGGNFEYGTTENQLGNSTGPTFWQAAKDILLECHKLLKPGTYSFWVVKMYVKSGAIVDFPGQWLKLCEACGFEHVETIIAWQTEDKGTNFNFAGEKQKKVVKRKSFFRILYEKKNPDNAIDSEIVLVMRKHL